MAQALAQHLLRQGVQNGNEVWDDQKKSWTLSTDEIDVAVQDFSIEVSKKIQAAVAKKNDVRAPRLWPAHSARRDRT